MLRKYWIPGLWLLSLPLYWWAGPIRIPTRLLCTIPIRLTQSGEYLHLS